MRKKTKENLPNTIVIGAGKCGTTSLHYYLSLHPDIYMSAEKELNFFATERNWRKGIDWYRSNFRTAARFPETHDHLALLTVRAMKPLARDVDGPYHPAVRFYAMLVIGDDLVGTSHMKHTDISVNISEGWHDFELAFGEIGGAARLKFDFDPDLKFMGKSAPGDRNSLPAFELYDNAGIEGGTPVPEGAFTLRHELRPTWCGQRSRCRVRRSASYSSIGSLTLVTMVLMEPMRAFGRQPIFQAMAARPARVLSTSPASPSIRS